MLQTRYSWIMYLSYKSVAIHIATHLHIWQMMSSKPIWWLLHCNACETSMILCFFCLELDRKQVMLLCKLCACKLGLLCMQLHFTAGNGYEDYLIGQPLTKETLKPKQPLAIQVLSQEIPAPE